jgi:tRNA (adenine-N(1)-)-methyltransferase non-catalytic subunit
VHLGKFGSFPASELLGLHYDITYEIYPDPSKPLPDKSNKTSGGDDGAASASYGQGKSKKQKKQAAKEGGVRSNPGWSYLLRPLKRAAVADLIIGAYSARRWD